MSVFYYFTIQQIPKGGYEHTPPTVQPFFPWIGGGGSPIFIFFLIVFCKFCSLPDFLHKTNLRKNNEFKLFVKRG